LIERGLGSKNETARLYQVSPDGGGSTFRFDLIPYLNQPILKIHEVGMISLDALNLQDVGLIKISSEGYELEILKGAIKTLENNKFPPILFDAWPTNWYEKDRNELFQFVEKMGYTLNKIEHANNMYLAIKHETIPEGPITEEFFSTIPDLQADTCIYFFRAFLKKRDILSAKLCLEKAALLSEENNNHKIYECIAELCLFTGEKEIGYSALEHLLFSSQPTWHEKNKLLSVQSNFMVPISFKEIFAIQCKLPEGFKSSSTAIINYEDGFLLNVRLVNYSINKSNGSYDIKNNKGTVITKNMSLMYDSSFSVTEANILTENKEIPIYESNIIGMEDIRLFSTVDFLCTSLEINKTKTPQICYGKICRTSNTVEKFIPLTINPEAPLKCEKNWIPFVKDDEAYIIYSIYPLKIYHLNRSNGVLTNTNSNEYPSISPSIADNVIYEWRGSTNLIPYKEGFLGIIHMVHYNNPRNYFHRLIWFSENFSSLKYSKSFYFETPSIEYTVSICHSDKGLLVPYSKWDNSSTMGILDYDVLDSMLEYN
jgi:hypothetical protein